MIRETTLVTEVPEIKRKSVELNFLPPVEDNDPVFKADIAEVVRMQQRAKHRQVAPTHGLKPSYVTKKAKEAAAKLRTTRVATRVGTVDAETGEFIPSETDAVSTDTQRKLASTTSRHPFAPTVQKVIASVIAMIGIPALIGMFLMAVSDPVKADPSKERTPERSAVPVPESASVPKVQPERDTPRCRELLAAKARGEIKDVLRDRSGECATVLFENPSQMDEWHERTPERSTVRDPLPTPAPKSRSESVAAEPVKPEPPVPIKPVPRAANVSDPCEETGQVTRADLVQDRIAFERHGFSLKSDIPLFEQAEQGKDGAEDFLRTEEALQLLRRRVCGLSLLPDASSRMEQKRAKRQLKELM